MASMARPWRAQKTSQPASQGPELQTHVPQSEEVLESGPLPVGACKGQPGQHSPTPCWPHTGLSELRAHCAHKLTKQADQPLLKAADIQAPERAAFARAIPKAALRLGPTWKAAEL